MGAAAVAVNDTVKSQDLEFDFTLAQEIGIGVESVEDLLRGAGRSIPDEAMECLGVQVTLEPVGLNFYCGRDELIELLGKLRSRLKDLVSRRRTGRPTAREMTQLVLDLNPVCASFATQSESWNGPWLRSANRSSSWTWMSALRYAARAGLPPSTG